jgi:hypothetical protein
MFKSIDISISYIADNDKKKHGTSRCGVCAQSVESLVDLGFDNIAVLVIPGLYSKEISAQLASLGFTEGENFFTVDNYAIHDSFSLISDEHWLYHNNNVLSGYSYYIKISKKYSGLPIWLMYQPSIGDLHIFSLFLPHLMGVRSVSECDCVLIVTKNSTRKYAEAIGYRNIELVSFEVAVAEIMPLLSLAGDGLHMKNAVYHGTTRFFESLVWHSGLNFRDSFTKFVFGFDDDPNPIYFDLPKRTSGVDKIFKNNNLIPGRTVLISPYAGVIKAELTMDHWVFLVDSLVEKGYTVCTNSSGEHEPPLPNTSAPFIELQDCVEFVETAGYFIGVRSGLCDAISTAKCLKIAIYDVSAIYTPPHFFSFESMGLGDGFTELYIDPENTDAIIEKVLEHFDR